MNFSNKSAWLEKEDCNVIAVDWSILANGSSPQGDPVKNVSIAGTTTGALINWLISQGTPMSAFHHIGFGIGVG